MKNKNELIIKNIEETKNENMKLKTKNEKLKKINLEIASEKNKNSSNDELINAREEMMTIV